MGVRDGAAWISRAIASVLAQTLTDLELVVVDDGSTDATAALLSGVRDPRLVIERQAPAGLTVALNRALGERR
jgi:glycosyltransferase involved in cell wall biosynthesis